MANVAAPKTRILSGAGILYRAPIGTPLPGAVTTTVTTKALTSNIATLTTAAAHGLIVGQTVTVAISDAVFDGVQTITAVPTTTTFSYAKTNANVTSGAATGTATSEGGGVVSGSRFVDAWPAAWVPVGVTLEGHEWSYSVKADGVEVAEYLLPVLQAPTGAEGKVSLQIAQYTAANMAWALNGGSLTTVSGTGASLLTKVGPAPISNQVRTMLGWESDDNTERGIFYQLLQTGDMKSAHKKGTDIAALDAEFTMEQPSVGDAFNRFYAGAAVVGL